MPFYNLNPDKQPSIPFKWVNPDVPSGATITSSLTANPKTAFAFASSAVIPEITAQIGGIAHIQGRGIFGSGVVSLGLTVGIDMAGVTVAQVAITPALNLTDMPWNIDVNATILATGEVEVQGQASFSSSLTQATVINIQNKTTFTMSTAGGVPISIWAQYGGLAVGGKITLRQMIVEVF